MKKLLVAGLLLGVGVLLCRFWLEDPVAQAGQDDSAPPCANVNGDAEANLTDAVYLLNFLFLGGPELDCPGATASCGNVNRDEDVDITDAVYVLNWLFLGGPVPECGGAPGDIEGFTLIGDNEQGYPEYTHDMTGIVLVRLPGGTFNMGAQAVDPKGQNYDPDARPQEGPVHEVTLSPFLIAMYELTQAQWEQVMGSNPSFFDGEHDFGGNPIDPPYERSDLPVESVSWGDIQAFEAATGLRLPTEAQWEFSCRAGTSTPISGTGNMDDMGWYSGNSGGTPHPIGTKAPNQFGLHDMHGNVQEWCEDWKRDDFYAESQGATDPLCTTGSIKVCRGGAYGQNSTGCRSAWRAGHPPAFGGLRELGIRPAFWPLPE